MSQDQRHQGYGEQEDDSISIRELLQTLARNAWLILLVTLLVSTLSVFWVATRTPVFEAKATLLLEADESAGGVLSQLASLSSDPAAEAEIALIRSRSLASVTAAQPVQFQLGQGLFDATQPDFDPVGSAPVTPDASGAWDNTRMEALGLATCVEPFDLHPSTGILNRITGRQGSKHRLRARLELSANTSDQSSPPSSLDVSFPSAGSVRIAAHERFLFPPSLESTGAGVIEQAFQPGVRLQALGYDLYLAPYGDYVGQRYRLSRVSELDAIVNLMNNTSAAEVGRQTNVVNVTVRDSSPYRAAEIANSLAKNYIRRSVQIGRLKATRTLGFIQGQLGAQLENLKAAERAMTELQSANPATISLVDSAKGIIELLTTLELSRTQLQLSQAVLREALLHLDEGDYVALARLGKESHNLLAFGYIQELAILEAESLRLDRTDVQGYRQLLKSEQLRLGGLIQETELAIQSFENGLRELEGGNSSALVRVLALPGSDQAKSGFDPYLAQLAVFDAEIASKQASALPANPELQALIESRNKFIQAIAKQVEGSLEGTRLSLEGYRSLHAEYSASIEEWPLAERQTIEDAMATLRVRVRDNLRSQLAGLEEQVAAIALKVDEQNASLGMLPRGQLALAQSTRDRATYAEIVAFLLKSEQEAKITAAATSAAAVLIDPAVPPTERQFPRTTLFILLGIVVGSVLGAGLALVRNALQAALHTEAEVERASGLPVIGAIPDYTRGRTKIKAARRGQRFLPMRDAPHGPQAEAYRAVRATLKQAMRGDDALRTLASTSCMMGEGKTVTNCDLAIVFTKAGRRVLLVDCDLRRPQVHKLFDTQRGPGFAEVLEDQAAWRDCVAESGIDGLSILPAGRTKANAGELLVSQRAVQVIEELKREYDLVVFDLPPAVVVADVASFASNLDALLLVYRSGVAPGRLLTRTVNMLRQTDVNVLGIIVNAIYMGRMSGDYGYGYEDDYTSLPSDEDDSGYGGKS